MEWNYEELINKEILEIKELKEKGYTIKEILDKNCFCNEALRACEIPLTYLIPKSEGGEMTFEEWETHIPYEGKWEYFNGYPFGNEDERDRILLGLLYTAGLSHLLDILPTESIKELVKLLNKKNE